MQVMASMFYLMPAMLAYTIPIAALFAAVLVYWRMSTDNELDRVQGWGQYHSRPSSYRRSCWAWWSPALTGIVFVNYVVPRLLQLTERAVRSDVGSLIVSQISRQEKFQYEAAAHRHHRRFRGAERIRRSKRLGSRSSRHGGHIP